MSAMSDLREARRRNRLPRPRSWDFAYPLVTAVAALVGWHLWVTIGDVPQYQFPTPRQVATVVLNSSELLRAAQETVLLIGFGFLLAIALGLGLALLTLLVRPFEIAFFPLVVATQFVPLIALTPLFVMWLGFDAWPKLVIIMLFGYFSILITALTGLRALETEKIYLARSMGASGIGTLAKIRIPSALPHLFAGIKITITSCVIGAVIAEFFVGSSGLGYQIMRSQGAGDSQTLIAAVVYLAVIGAVSFGLVSIVERLALPWHVGQRARPSS